MFLAVAFSIFHPLVWKGRKLGVSTSSTDSDAIDSVAVMSKSPKTQLIKAINFWFFPEIILSYAAPINVFFLILTVQKLRSFTTLRAIGASTSYLAWSLIGEIVILVSLGSLSAGQEPSTYQEAVRGKKVL